MPPQDAIRFVVVGDDPSHRSWQWRAWVHQGQIYARPRYGHQHIRASLHSSGHCHVALRNVPEDGASERVNEFRLAGEMAPGVQRVFAILIPHTALLLPSEEVPSANTTLIPTAGPGTAVEIDLFIQSVDYSGEDWPGQRIQGTHLLGRLPRDATSELVAVWWHVEDELGEERRMSKLEQDINGVGGISGQAPAGIDLDKELSSPEGLRMRVIMTGTAEVDNQQVPHFTEVACIARRS